MTGRRPHHTLVFDNTADFRKVGIDAGGSGASWTTLPGHFKKHHFTVLGGGKTFHPDHPPSYFLPSGYDIS